ncbi:MAG: hypothetical protein R6U84_06190 [Candidatus Cloacimonadales bacterium]
MKLLILLVMILAVSQVFALMISPELPTVYEKGADFTIRITSGFETTSEARLLYRAAGEQGYAMLEMERGSASNPVYSAEIPPAKEFLSAVEYYFEIVLDSGEIVTYPELNAQINPQKMIVAGADNISEAIVLLSPDPDFPSDSKELIIAFSYFSIQDKIKTNSIKLMVNGRDMTDRATISSNMAVLKIAKPKSGKNRFYLEAETVTGNQISSQRYEIKSSQAKFDLPLNLNGSAQVFGRLTSDSSEDLDQEANLRLLLNGRRNWFNFRSRLFLSSLEDSNQQSVNRYSLQLGVPHFKILVGDSSPNFGAYAINSINIRGIYSELYFSKFRLKTVFGDSKRAVAGELNTTFDDDGEPSYSNNDIEFRRQTMGIRTEFGHERYFNFAFNIVKNKDEIASLSQQEYNAPDSTLLVRPKDNLVLSTDSRFSFKDQRVVFGAEAAMSLYNSNIIDGSISQDSLETLAGQSIPIDPADFENIFVINSDLEPFKPGLTNLSYKAYLRIFAYRNLLNISYSYVGNSFNNLSAGYLAKDLATISINDNLNLFRNRLQLNLSYNLSSNNQADDKEFTTTNSSVFAQIYLRPTDESYLNFSYNSNLAENDVSENDDFNGKYEVNSETINVGGGYQVNQIDYAPTRFNLAYSNSVSSEVINNNYNLNKDVITLSAVSNYRDFPLKSTLGYSLALDDNSNKIPDSAEDDETSWVVQTTEYSYHSVFAKASYLLFSEKLEPNINFRLSVASGDFEFASQMLNIGSKYKLDQYTDLLAAVGFSNYSYENREHEDSSEVDLRINLRRRF